MPEVAEISPLSLLTMTVVPATEASAVPPQLTHEPDEPEIASVTPESLIGISMTGTDAYANRGERARIVAVHPIRGGFQAAWRTTKGWWVTLNDLRHKNYLVEGGAGNPQPERLSD